MAPKGFFQALQKLSLANRGAMQLSRLRVLLEKRG